MLAEANDVLFGEMTSPKSREIQKGLKNYSLNMKQSSGQGEIESLLMKRDQLKNVVKNRSSKSKLNLITNLNKGTSRGQSNLRAKSVLTSFDTAKVIGKSGNSTTKNSTANKNHLFESDYENSQTIPDKKSKGNL